MIETEAAYIAGVLDSRGWIGKKNPGKGNGSRVPAVEIESADLEILYWLEEKIGGIVVDRPGREGRKNKKAWKAQGYEARKALEIAYPFMLNIGRKSRIDEVLGRDKK